MSSGFGSTLLDAVGRVVPGVIRRSFARKFVLVVLVAMVVMGGVGGWQYLSATERVEAQADDQVSSTAALQAEGMEDWIRSNRQYTATISEARPFQNGNPKEIQLYLFDIQSRLPESAVDVHFIDMLDGEILASTNREVVGNYANQTRATWASALDDITDETDQASYAYVEDEPYQSPRTNETVIAFISAPQQNTQHAVVITTSLDQRAAGIEQTSDGAYTTIRTADGGTILRTGQVNETLPASALGTNETGVVSQGSEVIGHATVDGAAWTVVTHVPKDSAFAMRDQIGWSMLTMLLTGLLVLGVVAVGVGRRVGGTLDRLTSRAEAMEAGDLSVELQSNRADEFGRLFRTFDSMRETLREQIADAETAKERAESAKADAETAQAEAEQARQKAVELNDRLEATAADFGEVMGNCAEGDLSARMPTDAESDAMAEIATAFNAMMDEWEATIERVRAFGQSVERASTDVATNVDDAQATSEGLSGEMAGIAADATSQADDLQSVRDEMQTLSASVEEASASANEVADVAAEVLDSGEAGRDAAAAAMDELDAIEARTSAATKQVEQLQTLVDDIEAVVDVITDIAEQTNMLALNANIEAARADGESDGFGVVANEIKGLVEETQDATADIEETIEEVKSQTDETVAEMHSAQEKVEAGGETIEDALTAFDTIVDDIEETVDGIQEIDRATADQADSTQEVMVQLESVTEVSTETATAADNAATAARDQAEQMETVTTSVDNLASQAEQLRDLLADFETGDGEKSQRALEPGEDSQPALGDATPAEDQPALDEGEPTPAISAANEPGRPSALPGTSVDAAATDGGTDDTTGD